MLWKNNLNFLPVVEILLRVRNFFCGKYCEVWPVTFKKNSFNFGIVSNLHGCEDIFLNC
jgi:hypothetical protein